jgi:hypothetical protein
MATSSLGSPNDGRGAIGLHPVWMTLQPTEGVRPYVRKNRHMRPSNADRTVWNVEAIDTSHLSKVQSVDQRISHHACWPGESIGRPPLLLR